MGILIKWKERTCSLGDLSGGRPVKHRVGEFTWLGKVLFRLGLYYRDRSPRIDVKALFRKHLDRLRATAEKQEL